VQNIDVQLLFCGAVGVGLQFDTLHV